MTASKYTDRRGLEVMPEQVSEMFQRSGLNRRAFESACDAANLEPWQRMALLDVYCMACRSPSLAKFLAVDLHEFQHVSP